jgi:hypothetical protein
VNSVAAVAWLDTPPTVTVTVTVPALAAGGESARISSELTGFAVAGLPPNVTVTLQPASRGGQDRPVPVISSAVNPVTGPLSGRIAVITGPLTEIDSGWLVSVIGGLCESVTVTVKEYVPATSGVPEICPVEEFNVSPGGSDPELTDHEYGATPLTAASDAEYG